MYFDNKYRGNFQSGNSNIDIYHKIVIFGIGLFFLVIVSGIVCQVFGLNTNGKADGQLLKIVFVNPMFWVNFVIILSVATFLKIYKNTHYSLKELGIQIGATFAILTIAYFTIFTTTTDLKQTEFWNGQVSNVTFEEKWTEEYDCSYTECSGSGKNEKCRTVHKTCYTDHPDNYFITTSNQTQISINEHNWITFSKDFGAKEVKMNRSSQTLGSRARGEGDIWYVYPNKNIPVAEEHSYINYIVASKRTIHKQFQTEISEDDKKSLYEYPQLFNTKYGKIGVNRVLGKQHLDTNISNEYEVFINEFNALVGKTKEVNIFLYVLKNKDRRFLRTIESSLKYNKNDAIIVLNIDDNGAITWSDSVNFLSGAKFIISAKSQFDNLNINEIDKMKVAISTLVNKEWERVEMKNFEYLLGDIDIDIKWELLIIFINLIVNVLLFKHSLSTQEYL